MIVADTNVLFSAILAPGLCRDLVRGAIVARELAVSQDIVDELRTVMQKKTRWTKADIEERAVFYLAPSAAAMVVPADVPENACPDPKDLPVLGTALAARADFLVTGDQHLLALKKYRGIRIVSPRGFLQSDHP